MGNQGHTGLSPGEGKRSWRIRGKGRTGKDLVAEQGWVRETGTNDTGEQHSDWCCVGRKQECLLFYFLKISI